MPRRFEVALSFAGERRSFVRGVAHSLADRLGRDAVFFDEFHRAELARLDLDTYLQRVYHDDAALIVVFVCADYEQKDWCGLEWRAIRDLIKIRQASTIMPIRFDETRVPGLFSHDGYLDARNRSAADVAECIVERLRGVQQEHRQSACESIGQFRAEYLTALGRIDRSPRWDEPSTEEPAAVLSARLRYSIQHRDDPPAYTPSSHLSLRERSETVTAFADRLMSRSYPDVVILLGAPGSGKTTIAVQALAHAAARARDDPDAYLPLYVNLRYFTLPAGETDWFMGFRLLVTRSLEHAGPRFKDPLKSRGHPAFGELLTSSRLLVLLDGMDEMSTVAYSSRVRAIVEFLMHATRHRFLLTCRYADFVRLKDPARTLRIQRYDLMPWTRSDAASIVRASSVPPAAKDRILALVAQSDEWSPLEIRFLLESVDDVYQEGLCEAFIVERLAAAGGRGGVEPSLVALEQFAARNVLGPRLAGNRAVSANGLRVAQRAGLLYESGGEVFFTIRPLQNYCLARWLWRAVQDTGDFPAYVRLDDVNLVEPWEFVSRLLWKESEGRRTWLALLRKALDPERLTSGTVLADRLLAVS